MVDILRLVLEAPETFQRAENLPRSHVMSAYVSTCCCCAMGRSSLVKLLILMLVAIVICLPEFFPSHQDEGRIAFSCTRFKPSLKGRQCDRVSLSCNEDTRDTDRDLCVTCTNSSTGGPSSIHAGTTNETCGPGLGWFRCKTKTDLGLYHLSSLLTDVDLSIIQFQDSELYNITLVGCSNGSCEHRVGGQRSLFCCQEDLAGGAWDGLSPTNLSRCILTTRGAIGMSINITLLWTRTQHGFFWSCSYRLVWFAAVTVIILLVLIATTQQVLKNRFRQNRVTHQLFSLPVSACHSNAQCGPPVQLLQGASQGALFTIYEVEERESQLMPRDTLERSNEQRLE